ncbi:hypothetical protein CAEBREN_16666 [Caenorhabditis brenneri]|uniref:Uncharacterized protein n=1 Tax=Caenorhabditis brenneri TaxID=135651 RepID=G0MSG2_CAEBE|nr:hypothetical protein CAEBREN_16666 [Caenorhabditis brenneri]
MAVSSFRQATNTMKKKARERVGSFCDNTEINPPKRHDSNRALATAIVISKQPVSLDNNLKGISHQTDVIPNETVKEPLNNNDPQETPVSVDLETESGATTSITGGDIIINPTLTTTEVLMEMDKIELGTFLQMSLKGQVLRQVNKEKVLALNEMPITQLFGPSIQAIPIILVCKEQPINAIIAEANHRVISSRRRYLSEEDQKTTFPYIKYICSQSLFEHAWTLSHPLIFEECFENGRMFGSLPRFSEFPVVLQKLFLGIANRTAQLEKSIFSVFEQYTLQSAFFEANINENLKLKLQYSVADRNSYYDGLASNGLVPPRGPSEKETIPLYIYLMPNKTKTQCLEALKIDSLPKTKKAHITLFNAALSNDSKANELLDRYLRPSKAARMTQESLLIQLEVLAKTGEYIVERTPKMTSKGSRSIRISTPSNVGTTAQSSSTVPSESVDERTSFETVEDVRPINDPDTSPQQPESTTPVEAEAEEHRGSCVPPHSVVLAHIVTSVKIVDEFDNVPRNAVFVSVGKCPEVRKLDEAGTTLVCILPSREAHHQISSMTSDKCGLASLNGSSIGGKGVFPTLVRGPLCELNLSHTSYSSVSVEHVAAEVATLNSKQKRQLVNAINITNWKESVCKQASLQEKLEWIRKKPQLDFPCSLRTFQKMMNTEKGFKPFLGASPQTDGPFCCPVSGCASPMFDTIFDTNNHWNERHRNQRAQHTYICHVCNNGILFAHHHFVCVENQTTWASQMNTIRQQSTDRWSLNRMERDRPLFRQCDRFLFNKTPVNPRMILLLQNEVNGFQELIVDNRKRRLIVLDHENSDTVVSCVSDTALMKCFLVTYKNDSDGRLDRIEMKTVSYSQGEEFIKQRFSRYDPKTTSRTRNSIPATTAKNSSPIIEFMVHNSLGELDTRNQQAYGKAIIDLINGGSLLNKGQRIVRIVSRLITVPTLTEFCTWKNNAEICDMSSNTILELHSTPTVLFDHLYGNFFIIHESVEAPRSNGTQLPSISAPCSATATTKKATVSMINVFRGPSTAETDSRILRRDLEQPERNEQEKETLPLLPFNFDSPPTSATAPLEDMCDDCLLLSPSHAPDTFAKKKPLPNPTFSSDTTRRPMPENSSESVQTNEPSRNAEKDIACIANLFSATRSQPKARLSNQFIIHYISNNG